MIGHAPTRLARVVRALAADDADRRGRLIEAWTHVGTTGDLTTDARIAALADVIEGGGLDDLTDDQVDDIVEQVFDLHRRVNELRLG